MTIQQSTPVITIDGPCGSGKGTISQLLAQEKGWNLLLSGLIYRALALIAKQHGIDPNDESRLEKLANQLDIKFVTTSDNITDILLGNKIVTDIIYTEEIGNLTSKISALPKVRAALLDKQRAFRAEPGLVAEGRDMGTVVFPDAEIKFFLTASLEERAKRRQQQLLEKGINVKLSNIIDELLERDTRDRQRKISPLKETKDAVVIDTTNVTIDEVLNRIKEVINEKLGN